MEKSEKQTSEKMKELIEKAREIADKAEDLIENTAEKVKNSETLKKAGRYIDEKLDELEKSDIPEKLKVFADKVEEKTVEIFEKTKVHGKKFADTAEDFAEDLAGTFKSKTKKGNGDAPPSSPPAVGQ